MQSKQDLLAKVLQYKRWLLIGGGALILLFIISLFFQGGPSVQERAMNAQDRIQKLQEFMTTQRQAITTAALVNQSANTTAILSGAASSIQQLNETVYGGKAKATDPAKKANTEQVALFKTRMQTAKEANTFELRYRQTVVDELKAIGQEAAKLASSGKGAVSDTFGQIRSNLTTAQSDLAKIEL